MNHIHDQAQALREQVFRQRAAARVVTISSGKGGVGKTSMAVNLSIALSQMGLRVLVVDADFGLANIDVMLGVNSKYNLSHLLKGQCSLEQIIQEGRHGVRFISGGSGVFDLLHMSNAQLCSIMGELMNLSAVADMIIFDTGAGVNDHILQLIGASTESIVVTTPEPTAILDAYALIKTICKQPDAPPISVIMNKVENRREAENATAGFQNIIKKYLSREVASLGYVPFDGEMSKAIKRQVPIMVGSPYSLASRSITTIAQRLANQPPKAEAQGAVARFFMRFLG